MRKRTYDGLVIGLLVGLGKYLEHKCGIQLAIIYVLMVYNHEVYYDDFVIYFVLTCSFIEGNEN